MYRYVKEVTEQMQERELQRLLDAERIEEESRMINKALIAMQKEEEERQKQKHKDNMNRRNDLLQANTELERYRLIQKEEERIAEMRVTITNPLFSIYRFNDQRVKYSKLLY